ncbi:MAG: MarR family transcriptional regulator [Clostridiales bacterium]|nr:MarR family transcriptional regulator [Clostridiales bacterium]
MAKEQEVLELLNEFNSIHPLEFLQHIDMTSMGIGNVLGFLCASGREVTAGEISEYMNVSTARVAVLLKKMSDKELINRRSDPNDKRKVMVSITPKGISAFEEKKKEILLYAGAIVDHFGKEKVEDFIESCRNIRDIVDRVEKEQNTKATWRNRNSDIKE